MAVGSRLSYDPRVSRSWGETAVGAAHRFIGENCMGLRKLWSGMIFAVLAGSTANAAVVLDQSDTTTQSSYSGQDSIGQSFTAGMSGILSLISLGSSTASANQGISTVSIYSGGPSSAAAGSLLASGSFAAMITSTDYSYDVSSLNVNLASGSKYTFVITNGTGAQYSGYNSTSDTYSGGNSYFSTYSIGSFDTNFKTYMASSATTSVPEPATWAMMFIGFGLVGAAIRREKRPARTVSRLPDRAKTAA